MDIKKIKQLAKIMEENDLQELSLHEKEDFITLKRGNQGVSQVIPQLAPPVYSQPVVAEQVGTPIHTTSQGDEVTASNAPSQQEGTVVRSPMVGTFYSSPSPDSPPFVSVGDTVSKGDHLCIIEAMKVMNHIKSEYVGTVKEILVKDGDPLEYDTPLFVLKEN